MKTKSSKASWQSVRDRYTWYLRPPFKHDFDRSHWWKNETPVEPVAALYELARRHPKIGDLWLTFDRGSWDGKERRTPHIGAADKIPISEREHPAIDCLCVLALKSWPRLDWSERELWEMCAQKMKGLDCRDDTERCSSISSAAEMEILRKRADTIKLGKDAFLFKVGAGRNTKSVVPAKPHEFAKGLCSLAKYVGKNPIAPAEMEAAIAREAVAAHDEGNLLFSVAPDLTLDEAKILFEREYRRHLKLTPKVKQRARPKDWLRLIEQFDNPAASTGGVNSSGFNKYKKAIDGIRF